MKFLRYFISISFTRMYKSYKNVNFSGIPFDLTFHSSSTGRYKTHYNLSWTLKSFVPIQKTELQYKNKVSNVLSCMQIAYYHLISITYFNLKDKVLIRRKNLSYFYSIAITKWGYYVKLKWFNFFVEADWNWNDRICNE